MSIHSEHPFETDPADRDPIRRFRGRLGGTVSLWTSGADRERAGLTVSSYLISPGEPSRVAGLIHSESELLESIQQTGAAVVTLLQWRDRQLADVFAGLMPAPGGPFRGSEWEQTPWGPRLAAHDTWLGVRFEGDFARPFGWSVLVEGVVEQAEVGEDGDPLVHRRGRYQRPS